MSFETKQNKIKLYSIIVFILSLSFIGCVQNLPSTSFQRSTNLNECSDCFWDIELLPIVIETDSDLDPIITENIRLALVEWNNILGFNVFETQVVDIQDRISYGVLTDPPFGHVYMFITELGRSYNGEYILGLARRDIENEQIVSGVIYLDEELNDVDSFIIVLHELGHILNLRHDQEDTNSIMFSRPLEGLCIVRPEDIQWIQNHLFSNPI